MASLARRRVCAWRIANSRVFLGFREAVIWSAGGGEFDRRGGDYRESVQFSCRLEDATSGNTQQLAATSGNSQRAEVEAFKQQAATGSNSRQHAATRPKPRSPETELQSSRGNLRFDDEEPVAWRPIQTPRSHQAASVLASIRILGQEGVGSGTPTRGNPTELSLHARHF